MLYDTHRPKCVLDTCERNAHRTSCKGKAPRFRAYCSYHHEGKGKAHGDKVKLDRGCDNPNCTATITIAAQLQWDHINGDRFDNRLENLQLLCATCHSLKTFLERDHLSREKRGLEGKKIIYRYDELFSLVT